MEKKNSIRERAKKNSPKVKAKVDYLNNCLEALYLLHMDGFVTWKEYQKIFKKIKKQF